MKLTVRRPSESIYRNRNYKVLFNRQLLGHIGAGETLEFDIDNGGELQFKIDGWTGSPIILINPNEDQTIEISGQKLLSVSPILLGSFFLMVAVYSVNNRGEILTFSLAIICLIYLLLISLFRKNWLSVHIE